MRACSMLERSQRSSRRTAVATGGGHVAPAAVEMPRGQAVADEAFAWLNRQLTWQSTLADLEKRVSGDAPTTSRRVRTS
jgi:hypothetical protein